MNIRHTFFAAATSLSMLVGCPSFTPDLDESEWLPGGDTTNTFTLGNLAYSRPFENASREDEDAFFSGDSFFTNAWVGGISSTSARDGLGPLFNARSCTGCHSEDGRGRPPEPGEEITGLLFRLSTGELNDDGSPTPHPTYGGQLQNLSAGTVPPEGRVEITYTEIEKTYADGSTITLQSPIYNIVDTAYGDLTDVAVSPRVAPAVIGLSLLENIPESTLFALADEDDRNGDGISGRLNWVWSAELDRLMPGRFGWKAEQPRVRDQNAGAFVGDMGLTSSVRAQDDCTAVQQACLDNQNDDDAYDVSEHVFNRVATYTLILAPPARERWSGPDILAGRELFHTVGCQSCHVPSHLTGTGHEIDAADAQRIWPYTDLLLHDMGEALSDHRPSFVAEGAEWKTPPLWGLASLPGVNNHMRLLHDGRADGVEEAIMWHGGEATAAQENFAQLTADERQLLVEFVESL